MVLDTIVIGGGIAGLSAAAQLSRADKALVLEQERFPGYHTTGRSAALFSESYGNDLARALTRASRRFFLAPPSGFASHDLLHPRSLLTFGGNTQISNLNAFYERAQAADLKPRWLDRDAVLSLVPFRRDWIGAGVLEEHTADIDVHELLSGFLRLFKQKGGRFCGEARAIEIAGRSGFWSVRCEDGRSFRARTIVNAAGAWADEIALLAGVRPLGIMPLRRSALVFDPPSSVIVGKWPFCDELEEQFYFRPDAGSVMISLANETPSPPCDSRPEEMEIAEAIDRFTSAVDLEIRRVKRSWSGLRTFAPDRRPIAGFDSAVPGFFWLCGQGGVGVQTSPAMGQIAASLIEEGRLPPDAIREGITVEALSPARLKQATAALA